MIENTNTPFSLTILEFGYKRLFRKTIAAREKESTRLVGGRDIWQGGGYDYRSSKGIEEVEKRVGMNPQGVDALVAHGHRVLVERGAGEGGGFCDQEYRKAGAMLVEKAKDVWNEAEIVVKVKEPLEPEFPVMRSGQVLFTYLHLAANRELTLELMERRIVGTAMKLFRGKMDPFPFFGQ